MKTGKKKWMIPLVAVLVLALVGGIWALVARNNREPVFVYGFDEGIVGMKDYYDGGNETSGQISTDRIQPVFLSETQQVLEVLVEDGQSVKKGDVLFTYDTTLSDITLMQKDLAVQQAKLDLETARRELAVINSYVPISYHPVDPPEPTEPPEPVADLAEFDLEGKDYLAYSGSGKTSMTPKYCWIRSGAMVDEFVMQNLFAGSEEDVLFVKFQYTQGDTNDGDIIAEYGIKMMRLTISAEGEEKQYTYRYSFFNPNQVSNEPVDDGIDWNSGFTAAEIANMRAEKLAQIKEMEFGIKVGEAEFSIMQKEADSGEVLAQFDGEVQGLVDPESAAGGTPFMKVYGGGGFYVTGTVSENDMHRLKIGQKVTVTSWDTWQTYEGEVVEIQEFPQDNEEGYYRGDGNVSYYPYKIFIDDSADLMDGSYVGLQLQANEEQSGLYVSNAFVRNDGPAYYVFVRGADGKLRKQYIQVGGILYGEYLEVRGGITGDDYLAFPYGKTVKEGAPTQEGTFQDLIG